MTLIELLQWLVETWPERRSFRPDAELVRSAPTPEIAARRIAQQTRMARRTLGEGEWQYLCSLAATVAGAAWRHEMPFWETETSTTPEMWLARWLTSYPTGKHVSRRIWAMDDLGRDEHGQCEPVESLDRVSERWLTRLNDFGAAGGFGPAIREALPADWDFTANVLIQPDGTTIDLGDVQIDTNVERVPQPGKLPRQPQPKAAPVRDRIRDALVRDYPTKDALRAEPYAVIMLNYDARKTSAIEAKKRAIDLLPDKPLT